MANLGPASTTTVNSVLATANTNFASGQQFPMLQNANRPIAIFRGVSVGTAGDAAVANVNSLGLYSASLILVTNSQLAGVSGSIATANITVNTGPGVTGTTIVSAGALTSNTAATVANTSKTVVTTVINASVSPQLYVNVGTAVATGTCDIFIYGYDVT